MDLQLALIILGGFAIAGILVHGLWTIRNNSQKQADWTSVKKAIEDQQPKNYSDGFDHDGIGKVRVVHREEKQPGDDMHVHEPQQTDNFEHTESATLSAQQDDIDFAQPQVRSEPTFSANRVEDEVNDEHSSVEEASVESPRSEPKWTSTQHHYPDPPNSLLMAGAEPQNQPNKIEPGIRQSEFLEDSPVNGRQEPKMGDVDPVQPPAPDETDNKISLTEQAKKLVKREKPLKKIRRTEPRIAEDQLRIDFDDQPSVEEVEQAEQTDSDQEQEVLVLNVRMPEGKSIPGSALLPMLLTLGLKFGDQDIFHRHVNTNGKGPVLFSLANMFRPGVFDIDNMENFTTRGISLFMVLPIEGDPRQVFNMMHNASRKIADEFGAEILDGRRAILTKQALQQYMDKIRESERRRMLRKN
ncbi:cell division protein ZipA [Neptunicella sp. SCSIO 80796]|uniref:cell division protein ZipA n=1 Tax=Neptunicella plasticusilytica TaxID=3117012 RepID=UPI003A4E0FF0